jgi:hypothetical protein
MSKMNKCTVQLKNKIVIAVDENRYDDHDDTCSEIINSHSFTDITFALFTVMFSNDNDVTFYHNEKLKFN